MVYVCLPMAEVLAMDGSPRNSTTRTSGRFLEKFWKQTQAGDLLNACQVIPAGQGGW
jgi:hypothetical protein